MGRAQRLYRLVFSPQKKNRPAVVKQEGIAAPEFDVESHPEAQLPSMDFDQSSSHHPDPNHLEETQRGINLGISEEHTSPKKSGIAVITDETEEADLPLVSPGTLDALVKVDNDINKNPQFTEEADPFANRKFTSPRKFRRPQSPFVEEKDHLPQVPELQTQYGRKVRFDTENFSFFPSGRQMNNPMEWNRCWYRERELNRFRQDASKMAIRVLTNVNGPFAFIKQSSQQQKQAQESRSLLTKIFLECRNAAKTEEETYDENFLNKVLNDSDRQQLCQLYQSSEQLVGLEVFVMHGLRGEASFLCQRILHFVKEKMSESPKRRTQQKRRSLYARTSQTISRPSRVYAYELAVAQAAALQQQEMNT